VSPGGSFGELALMYNAPRAATVVRSSVSQRWLGFGVNLASFTVSAVQIAQEPTKTWAMDQLTFKSTLMSTTMKKRRCVHVHVLCFVAFHASPCFAYNTSTHEEFIRGVTLLSTLNEYERLTIADALVAMHYGPGETIIREGEGGQDFFFIEEGEVKATKAGVDGEVSRRLRSGDYFGEIALINNSVSADFRNVCA
jgi:cAMP-dependent protein kinase regulator